MPVSDASNVRAPARFNNQGNWQQANNLPINIQGQYQYTAQPQLYAPQQGVLAQSSTGYPNTYYQNPNIQNQNVQAGWQTAAPNNQRNLNNGQLR